jgi:uncharacterized membrane protein
VKESDSRDSGSPPALSRLLIGLSLSRAKSVEEEISAFRSAAKEFIQWKGDLGSKSSILFSQTLSAMLAIIHSSIKMYQFIRPS